MSCALGKIYQESEKLKQFQKTIREQLVENYPAVELPNSIALLDHLVSKITIPEELMKKIENLSSFHTIAKDQRIIKLQETIKSLQDLTSDAAKESIEKLAKNYYVVSEPVNEVYEDYINYSDRSDESWKEEKPSEQQVENIANIYQTINISIDKSSVKNKMYYFKLVAEIIGLVVSLITIFSFAKSQIEEHNSSSAQRPDYSVHDLNNSNAHDNKTIKKV